MPCQLIITHNTLNKSILSVDPSPPFSCPAVDRGFLSLLLSCAATCIGGDSEKHAENCYFPRPAD